MGMMPDPLLHRHGLSAGNGLGAGPLPGQFRGALRAGGADKPIERVINPAPMDSPELIGLYARVGAERRTQRRD